MGMKSDQNPHMLLYGHPQCTRVALSNREPVGVCHNHRTVRPTADDQVCTNKSLCLLEETMASHIDTLTLPQAQYHPLALMQTIGRPIPTVILMGTVLELETTNCT